MASKLANLQNALNKGRAPIMPTERQAGETTAARPTRQANREDKVNVAAWMHPDFKRSLRLVQARRPGTIQDLLEEALNDLFAKYDVPQVATQAEREL
jgi:hypothetical protein